MCNIWYHSFLLLSPREFPVFSVCCTFDKMIHNFPFHHNPCHHHRKLQLSCEQPPRVLKILTIIESSRTRTLSHNYQQESRILKQKLHTKKGNCFFSLKISKQATLVSFVKLLHNWTVSVLAHFARKKLFKLTIQMEICEDTKGVV